MEQITGIFFKDHAPTNGSNCQGCGRIIRKGEERLKINRSMSRHVCVECLLLMASKFRQSFEF